MNKLKAIKELDAKKERNEALVGIDEYSTGYKSGFEDAIEDALFIVDQIDEVQKPVVPQCVADWYEKHKVNLPYEIYELCVDYANNGYTGEFYDWFKANLNGAITTLVKMQLFDYEVAQEKRYTAKLVRTGEYLYHDVKYRQLYHTSLSDEMARDTDGCIFTKDELAWAYAWDNKAYDVEDIKE